MRVICILFISLLSVFTLKAQELNALVTVNADKISGSNKQVFETLQKSLTEFINQTKWTTKNFETEEKINCAFTITINEQPNTNRFEASIQVQSVRPVYGSTYSSPTFNRKDNDFNFNYTEFEPLNYSTMAFQSNLVSTIVYYVYVILGIDADTFALNGGDPYYNKAKEVMLLAQQSGSLGWQDETGSQNRFALIDNLTSPKLSAFKTVLYTYHRLGFDVFSENRNSGKNSVETAVITMQDLYNNAIGNTLIRLFFDTKSDEIVAVFSDGAPTSRLSELKEVLQKISPTNSSKWRKIK